jgi:hypothetical protein
MDKDDSATITYEMWSEECLYNVYVTERVHLSISLLSLPLPAHFHFINSLFNTDFEVIFAFSSPADTVGLKAFLHFPRGQTFLSV